jgi:HK97 family phage major capsid protein
MDIMKFMIEKKDYIKSRIEEETDEKEIKRLNEELMSVINEIAETKANEKAEIAYTEKIKEVEEKAMKEAMNATKVPDIKITEQGTYKGMNLKHCVGKAAALHPALMDGMRNDYQGVERMAKLFYDLADNAMARPTMQKATMVGVTSDALGGYITPTDERMEILGYLRQSSVALQDARVESMTGDKMTFPVELYNAVAAFRDESGGVGATSATFSQATLTTKGLDGYVVASKELVADSPTLIATLMSQFIEATAKKIDSAAFLGTGNPVSGVFTAATGYSSTFSATSTNFSALLSTNIDDLLSKVFARVQDTSRCRWYVHPAVFYKYLKALKDKNGQYLFWDSIGGPGMAGTFGGFPVRYVHQAQAVTGTGKTLAAFGDLSGMLIGERLSSMQMFYDPYHSAANGLDRFFWFTRWAFNYALPQKMGRLRSSAT